MLSAGSLLSGVNHIATSCDATPVAALGPSPFTAARQAQQRTFMRVPSAKYVSQSRIASPKGSSRINRQLTHLHKQAWGSWGLPWRLPLKEESDCVPRPSAYVCHWRDTW